MRSEGQRKLVEASFSGAGDFGAPKSSFSNRGLGNQHSTDYGRGGFGNKRGEDTSCNKQREDGSEYGGDSHVESHDAVHCEEEVWD